MTSGRVACRLGGICELAELSGSTRLRHAHAFKVESMAPDQAVLLPWGWEYFWASYRRAERRYVGGGDPFGLRHVRARAVALRVS